VAVARVAAEAAAAALWVLQGGKMGAEMGARVMGAAGVAVERARVAKTASRVA